MRGSHYYCVVVSPSFVDIDGPLLSGGAFYRGVLEDSVNLPVLDEGAARVFICGLGCLCTLISDDSSGLRMNSQRYPSLIRS